MKVAFEELTIPNNTHYLRDVREFVARMARRSSAKPEEENKIILAVDEAVSIIMKHAYRETPNGTISLEIIADKSKFQIIIRDSGKSFDPGTIKEPDLGKYVKTGKKEGLGIYLMRRIMDEVSYDFINGVRNELRMTKYFKE